MGAFSVRLLCEDIWQQLRCSKRKVLLCLLLAAAGIALGVVLMSLGNFNWWCNNRCEFARKLVCGGFLQVTLVCAVSAVACGFFLTLFLLWRRTHFLCYLYIVLIAVYCGANCAAVVCNVGLLGVLYLVLVLAVGQITDVLCCFLACDLPVCRRTVREVFSELKGVWLVQFVCFLYKILVIFVVLRLFTAAI